MKTENETKRKRRRLVQRLTQATQEPKREIHKQHEEEHNISEGPPQQDQLNTKDSAHALSSYVDESGDPNAYKKLKRKAASPPTAPNATTSTNNNSNNNNIYEATMNQIHADISAPKPSQISSSKASRGTPNKSPEVKSDRPSNPANGRQQHATNSQSTAQGILDKLIR